ncbi:hypothetical protein IEQ34_006613 [Dendrobium chrysotoxum]|uniref:Uncharacterized protein n=1 Tax=Dendrobium chrysotoxum TaxID=161865 RepID=A0AAV7H4H6_DENCH|nr:hypothetical protein IEQ34_006613 [Dendrobium chrysotoxum]
MAVRMKGRIEGAGFESEAKDEGVGRERGVSEERVEKVKGFVRVGGGDVAGDDGGPGDLVAMVHLIEQLTCVCQAVGFDEMFKVGVGLERGR